MRGKDAFEDLAAIVYSQIALAWCFLSPEIMFILPSSSFSCRCIRSSLLRSLFIIVYILDSTAAISPCSTEYFIIINSENSGVTDIFIIHIKFFRKKKKKKRYTARVGKLFKRVLPLCLYKSSTTEKR